MDIGLGFSDFGFSGFGIGFNLMSVLVMIIFAVVIGMFLFTIIKGIRQWNKNNHAPRLTVPATVVSKRNHVSRHHHHNHAGTGMHHTTFSTTYYVTFQVESGDRLELQVEGDEFGLLAEGDQGRLTFQGTRYLGFERKLDA